MKITLIKPNIGRKGNRLYVDQGRMEPLMLGVIAALTPPDVEVVLHDDRVEKIPFDEPTDLVAITVEIYTARRAYEIAAEYRMRNVPVILGGVHVTLFPEEPALHADSIFLGDAETLWPQVVEDARRGQLKPRYDAPAGVGQIGGVLPRRDLYKGKGYLPVALMQYSRGCRFACSFCAVSKYFGRKHFIRQIDDVVREICEQDLRLIFFVDDNIASHQQALKELCRELIPLKVRWVSQGSLDMTKDEELMQLLADSGCLGNVVGFETIVEQSLRDARKAPNIKGFSRYEREVAVLREYGMQTWAAFTLGYDHDTLDSIKATTDFALENRFALAAFNILMPYPNTPHYAQLEKEGRLLFDGNWWLHPEYRFNHAAFVPANMTPDELTEACHVARTAFNSLPSMVRRFTDVKTNLRTLFKALVYLRYSTLFRTEVHKKHGMQFGLK